MQSKYIREEIIVERTAREENKAVWEKETAILAALNEYYNSLNASIDDATVEAAMAGEFSRDYISGEMLKTGGGPQSCFALCSKVHWSIYYHRECMRAETSADALRELAAQDTTHCLTLRVIVQDSDPNLTPEIYVKAKDDTAIRNGDALWQSTVQSDDTWTGYVPLSGYLPNCTAVPQPIIDAYKAMCADFSPHHAAELFDEFTEEYEGGMESCAGEDYVIPGNQLPLFLARMQDISHMYRLLGGRWGVNGWLFNGSFGVLAVTTDDGGVIHAKSLKL